MIRPLVNLKMAVNLAKKIFNLRVPATLSIKELDSYEDRNFYIRGTLPHDEQEREYALKVCKYGESERGGVLDEISNVMFHLHNNGISCSIPQPTVRGKLYEMKQFATTPSAKQSHETRPEYCGCTVRLLSYVPGEMIRALPCSLNMFYQVGRFAAKVDTVLEVSQCNLDIIIRPAGSRARYARVDRLRSPNSYRIQNKTKSRRVKVMLDRTISNDDF